jgi:5-methylcytosine-specific restriction endonuclease McrBC regulatory subunit McrC
MRESKEWVILRDMIFGIYGKLEGEKSSVDFFEMSTVWENFIAQWVRYEENDRKQAQQIERRFGLTLNEVDIFYPLTLLRLAYSLGNNKVRRSNNEASFLDHTDLLRGTIFLKDSLSSEDRFISELNQRWESASQCQFSWMSIWAANSTGANS